MNPFTDLHPRRQPSPWLQLLARPAPLLLASCLVVGAAVVGWRAYARCRTAQVRAHAEVRARAAALQLQLNQAPAAAEELAALARQNRGVLTDFQKAAKELKTRYPGLNTLELQPNGIVSEVVPREENDRAIGFAVFRDAGQSAGANVAKKDRSLTVSGPVRLYHGEKGIVARVPVFQRAANGQESFWGFVAATMRLQDALVWTKVNELPQCGYEFALFVPASSWQKGLTLVSSSRYALKKVEQEPVQVQNVKFQLAVEPRAGWVDTTTLVTESLLVLLFSALVFIVASVLANRRAVDVELAQITERLNQEQAKRSEAEAAHTEAKDQMATVQSELKQAQVALEQANTRVAQLESRLEASARERDEAVQLEQAKEKEGQVALAKAQETIAQLQTRLEAATQAQTSAAAAAEDRQRQNQIAVVELRAKLEAATRSAREAAKASAAELAQLEQGNRDLKERLVKAEQAEARVKELKGQLRKAQAELKQWEAAAAKEDEVPSAEANGETEPQMASRDDGFAPTQDSSIDTLAPQRGESGEEDKEEPAPAFSDLPEASAPDDTDPSPAATAEAAAELPAAPATDSPPEPTPTPAVEIAAEAKPEEPAAGPELNVDSSSPEPVSPEAAPDLPRAGKADAPASEALPAVPVEAPPEPATPKAANKPKRRKASRDDQMDLFGGNGANGQAVSKSSPKSAERAHESKVAQPSEKPAHAPRLPTAPPLDAAELRKAVNVILPLLMDQDPGAKDCLRDNRNTFRSAFTPEAYVDFEQLVKHGDFAPALEDLKKAVRRHGIPV